MDFCGQICNIRVVQKDVWLVMYEFKDDKFESKREF